jgi:hypothetical protein
MDCNLISNMNIIQKDRHQPNPLSPLTNFHPNQQQSTTAKMRTLTTLITLLTTLTLHPLSTSASVLPLTGSLTTGITYHQCLVSSSNFTSSSGLCDAQIVAKGELTAGYCVGLQTYAISIARMANLECAFRLFRGSAGCDADATGMVSWFWLGSFFLGEADADDGFR